MFGSAWSKHTPLTLCPGHTVAADRLHGDAEPGLFPQRRFRSKHHRNIESAPFADLDTCSRADSHGVRPKPFYPLESGWEAPHGHVLASGSGSISMIVVLAEPVCLPNPRLASRLEPFAERCKLDGSELFIFP